jgi:hypothetical protein
VQSWRHLTASPQKSKLSVSMHVSVLPHRKGHAMLNDDHASSYIYNNFRLLECALE